MRKKNPIYVLFYVPQKVWSYAFGTTWGWINDAQIFILKNYSSKHLDMLMWYKLSMKTYSISNSQHDALKLRQELMAIWKQLLKLGCTFSHHKVIFLTLASQSFSLTWCNLHYYYFASLCYWNACHKFGINEIGTVNK